MSVQDLIDQIEVYHVALHALLETNEELVREIRALAANQGGESK